MPTKEIADRCEVVMAANPEFDFSETVHVVAVNLNLSHMVVQDAWTEHCPEE